MTKKLKGFKKASGSSVRAGFSGSMYAVGSSAMRGAEAVHKALQLGKSQLQVELNHDNRGGTYSAAHC